MIPSIIISPFSVNLLDKKILYGDYELLLLLEKTACHRLTQAAADIDTFSRTVKIMIYTLLSPEFPSLTIVATNLNMSERNTQRKLKDEGLTYSKILPEVKKALLWII